MGYPDCLRCSPFSPSVRSVSLAAGLVLFFAACGGGDSGTPTQPEDPQATTGAVSVQASTSGDTLDNDGYRVTVDGTDQSVAPDGSTVYSGLSEGDYSARLADVQKNCSASGGTDQSVSVTAGDTATVSFDVTCEPALFDRIVFVSDRDGNNNVYVMETDGSNPTPLTIHSANDFGPVVSPDGTRIAFTSRRNGDNDIYVMSLDGSDPRQLTDDPELDCCPAWSPDGSELLFVSERGDGYDDVFRMDADGTDVQQVTATDSTDDITPTWQDSSTIVFSSRRDGGHGDIYRMNSDGTGLERLTSTPGLDWASPAVGEAQIAFSGFDGSDFEVYVMNRDGSGRQAITQDSAGDSNPRWAPDGSAITFQTDRAGNYEIFRMNPDGSSFINLTNTPNAVDFSATWTPSR